MDHPGGEDGYTEVALVAGISHLMQKKKSCFVSLRFGRGR